MKRILFVDDEPNVLEGLRGLLRKQRKQWEMTFAEGGEQALRELAAGRYDLVVTDMRMPGIDGAALLRTVQQEYPHVIRIVLSGQTEQEVTRRMVYIAHQFISKPFDGRELQGVIERACRQQTLVETPSLRSAVGQIGQLPVRQALYGPIVEVLSNPQVTMPEAAAALERDPGLSAKFLQIVNSAFFGLRQRVVDVRTAVSALGLELVRTLAQSSEVQTAQIRDDLWGGFDLAAADRHTQLTAQIARRLLRDRQSAQDAGSAARLKDTGILVLMSHLPEPFGRVLELALSSGRPIWEVEAEVLGVTHAEIGAYLLGIWGLPDTIVDAVAHQHAPQRSNPTGLEPVCALHVASALAGEVAPAPAGHLSLAPRLDTALLARLELTAELPAWRQIAAEEADRPST